MAACNPKCVFTLGGEGAFYAHRDGTRLNVPAYDIDVVDTTGCGAAFDAGFICALHHRFDPETALRFAQAVAPSCALAQEDFFCVIRAA